MKLRIFCINAFCRARVLINFRCTLNVQYILLFYDTFVYLIIFRYIYILKMVQ